MAHFKGHHGDIMAVLYVMCILISFINANEGETFGVD